MLWGINASAQAWLAGSFCNKNLYSWASVWCVRIYGKIGHELKLVDFLPYIRTIIQLSYCTGLHVHFVHCEIFDVKH